MAKPKALTPAEKASIAADWNLGKGARMTQQELADHFQVSVITIRRALADEGLVDLVAHKTPTEAAVLEFLKAQGLDDIDTLRKFVIKARQGKSGR